MKANSACRCLVAIAIPPFATAATSRGTKSFFFAETLKYLLRSPGTTQHDQPKKPCSIRRSTLPAPYLAAAKRVASTAAGWSSVL